MDYAFPSHRIARIVQHRDDYWALLSGTDVVKVLNGRPPIRFFCGSDHIFWDKMFVFSLPSSVELFFCAGNRYQVCFGYRSH